MSAQIPKPWQQLIDRSQIVHGQYVRAGIPLSTGLVGHEVKELRADADGMEYDGSSMKWSDADFVEYKWTQTVHNVKGIPTGYSNDAYFGIGQWASGAATESSVVAAVLVMYSWEGRSDVPTEPWHGLVSLSRTYLEPRLLDDLLRRVRAGERARVIERFLEVDGEGLYFVNDKKPFRNWTDVYVTETDADYAVQPRKGLLGGRAIDKGSPNAFLIPRVYEAMVSAEERANAVEEQRAPPWQKWVIFGILGVLVLLLVWGLVSG